MLIIRYAIVALLLMAPAPSTTFNRGPFLPGPNVCTANVDEQQTVISRARHVARPARENALLAAANLFYQCSFGQRDVEAKIQDLDLSESLYQDAGDLEDCSAPAFAAFARAKAVITLIETFHSGVRIGVSPALLHRSIDGKVSACLALRRRSRSREG